jgi:hypothetical protein
VNDNNQKMICEVDTELREGYKVLKNPFWPHLHPTESYELLYRKQTTRCTGPHRRYKGLKDVAKLAATSAAGNEIRLALVRRLMTQEMLHPRGTTIRMRLEQNNHDGTSHGHELHHQVLLQWCSFSHATIFSSLHFSSMFATVIRGTALVDCYCVEKPCLIGCCRYLQSRSRTHNQATGSRLPPISIARNIFAFHA